MPHYTSNAEHMEVDHQAIKQEQEDYGQEYAHKRFNHQERGIQPTSPTPRTDPVSYWLHKTTDKNAVEQIGNQERYWDNISEISETPSEAGSTVPTPLVSPEFEEMMTANNVGTWGQPISIQEQDIKHHNQEAYIFQSSEHQTATILDSQYFPGVQHIKTEIVEMSPVISESEGNFNTLQMYPTECVPLENQMLRTGWMQLVNEQTPPTPPESPNDILQFPALKPDHFTFASTYPLSTDRYLDNSPQPLKIKSEQSEDNRQLSSSSRKTNKSRAMFNKRHGHLGGPFHCGECDRYFLKQNGFTQHMDVYHMGPRPFVCGQCGKSFREQDRLDKHEKCHDEQSKPYRCSACPKGFQHLQALERHFGMHHSKPSIWCEVCGKGFVRNDHLVSHLVSHDRNTVKPRKNKQMLEL